MDKSILIERKKPGEKQTLGRLYVLEKGGLQVYNCHTLELPWKENQRNISCIPEGEYRLKKRYSLKHKKHFHVMNVKGRSYILIHSGNYYTQIRGCILVGAGLKRINNDDLLDVTNSRNTLNDLLSIMPKEFDLIIRNC